MPVAIMLGGSQPYARVYVPEAIRIHVTPGTQATVHVDGLDRPLRGRVRWVAAEASFTPYFALTEHDRGRLTYVAKVDLDYDGVPVEAEFTLDGQ
jgi:HlyD family secretion protein